VAIPTAIGPYAVLEEVSARAFTVTYRAEQRPLGRAVLVKTLKPTVSAGSPFAAEIEREAAVLARLDHEGVVRLHDFVRTEDAVYLVLEDARGTPLAEILAAARLEPEVAAAVALAAARALAHAHARGVVHRALSAAAVAVAPGGRVIVTDFSAAGSRAGDLRGLPSIPEPVEAGESFARADFMAPEQILGEPAGPASDVWALGVLCHELLAGARPFDVPHDGSEADEVSSSDDSRAVAQRIRTAPPAPLPAAVPEALARIVARCLAKDPADRYPDAGAVAAALEQALARLSRLPVPVLVSRALAAAGRGEALTAPTAPARAAPAPATSLDVGRAARALLGVLALIVAGGVGLRLLDDPGAAQEGEGVPESAPAAAASRDRGLLRVVASPWAEVYVDGELVDVTPIGRPIPVLPGRHFVTFRHPSAPDEQRTIKITAGQSVFLDVTLRVDRGDAGAPRSDGGREAESP
jgi:eukaryotic-like serine/threonine-protein kinase